MKYSIWEKVLYNDELSNNSSIVILVGKSDFD